MQQLGTYTHVRTKLIILSKNTNLLVDLLILKYLLFFISLDLIRKTFLHTHAYTHTHIRLLLMLVVDLKVVSVQMKSFLSVKEIRRRKTVGREGNESMFMHMVREFKLKVELDSRAII